MNTKDILSENEQILFTGQQHRIVPGGKELTPGKIYVTGQRVILETTSLLGLKKDFEDLHYSDIMGIDLKSNVFSSDLIIGSRFQGEIRIKSIGKKDASQLEQIINQRTTAYGYGALWVSNNQKTHNKRKDFGGYDRGYIGFRNTTCRRDTSSSSFLLCCFLLIRLSFLI